MMSADAILREEIKQAASNAVHGHPLRPASYLGVWECVCGEPIQPISLAAARVADAMLPIIVRVEQEAYRRGQAEAWDEGWEARHNYDERAGEPPPPNPYEKGADDEESLDPMDEWDPLGGDAA